MTYAATRPTKEQVKRAIGDTLENNAKLYELLAKYDAENHVAKKSISTGLFAPCISLSKFSSVKINSMFVKKYKESVKNNIFVSA